MQPIMMKNTAEEVDHDAECEAEESEDFSSSDYFPKNYRVQAEEAISLKKVYILQLASHFEGTKARILVASSNHEHAVYDYNGYLRQSWSTPAAHEDNITGLKFSDSEDDIFYTSSLDGTIKLWDCRAQAKPSLVFKDDTDGEDKLKPISCFDVSCDSKFISAGTLSVEADAYLLFWDVRKSSVLGGYWEAHTDDVTQVKFHPHKNSTLMSASTDGLINIYDVSRECEDDAIENSLNVETSVQKIEWFRKENADVIGCITDMETVQFWKPDDVSPYAHFSRKLLASTLRLSSWDNAYISDLHKTSSDSIVLLGGSNVNKGEYLKSLTFSNGKLEPSATFENNKQLIRCSSYNAESDMFITAGESGIISVWTLSDPYDNKMKLKDSVNVNPMIHYECRKSEFYPRTENVKRLSIPDDKVSWCVQWSEYLPPDFTSPSILGQSWADPNISDAGFKPQWNSMDSNVDRVSACGTYKIVDGRPRNPIGRTGLSGRGLLGRWGPNKAADPIVTRWKMVDEKRAIDENSKKPILQFVAIERRDCGMWAIPGGMVDPGEQVSSTLKREFMEEALNIADKSEDEKNSLKTKINEFFLSGVEVFKGYVDDPRNTDNAWMETTAVHFHDEDSKSIGSLPLTAGDDARNVRWMDVSGDMNLYANHSAFMKTVAENIGAHW